jgi:hypothetical protein
MYEGGWIFFFFWIALQWKKKNLFNLTIPTLVAFHSQYCYFLSFFAIHSLVYIFPFIVNCFHLKIVNYRQVSHLLTKLLLCLRCCFTLFFLIFTFMQHGTYSMEGYIFYVSLLTFDVCVPNHDDDDKFTFVCDCVQNEKCAFAYVKGFFIYLFQFAHN